MTTEYYCTRCGKEFEPGETAYALDLGTVEKDLPLWDAELSSSQGAYEEVMCSKCHTKLFSAPEPNRVVVEVKYGEVVNVRAERPYEVVVAVLDHDIALALTEDRQPYPVEVWAAHDGDKTIGQLNTMKEEPIAAQEAEGGKDV